MSLMIAGLMLASMTACGIYVLQVLKNE